MVCIVKQHLIKTIGLASLNVFTTLCIKGKKEATTKIDNVENL